MKSTQSPSKPNGRLSGQVYDTYTLLEAYSSLLSSELDGTLIHLQGFYLDRKGKVYGKFYYDALSDKKTNTSITLQVNEELKATLINGGFYQMQGFINRGRLKDDFGLRMVFYVTKVEKHEKDVQLISEHQYNLVKSRFDKGMVNIESLLLDKLYQGERPRIAFITGEASVVGNDFFDQLESTECYDIEIIRVNLSTKTGLLEVIENWENEVDLLAFVRGGGSGLLLFDEEDLCTKVLELGIPIVTAIGHEVDQQLLSKIADRSFDSS